jgi:UDP-N-acetylglucosamine 2-epimerase
MAPVISTLRRNGFLVEIVASGQHTNLLDRAFADFGLESNFQIEIPGNLRSLPSMHSYLSQKLEEYLSLKSPELVLVHGDTLTASIAAVVANLSQIPVGHVEAGLRSMNCREPWPEEVNRRIIDAVSSLHFCPTTLALETLKTEGLFGSGSFVVGNTIVDAFYQTLKLNQAAPPSLDIPSGEYILFTQHRRESFGENIENLFKRIASIPEKFDLDIIFPMHPNPNVVNAAKKYLDQNHRVRIIEPCGYREMLYLLSNCKFVITDSGGIQEEAPLAGKRVLVTRNVTERPEILESGYGKLVGPSGEKLFIEIQDVLESISKEPTLPLFQLLGDGNSATYISNHIKDYLTDKV